MRGVAEINSIGGYAKEYQIAPDPKRLAAYKLTLNDLIAALERNNANIGAGYIERNGEQLLIRAPGQVASAEDIALTCHPHPTRSEALRQAAMNVEGMAMQI